MPVLDSPAHAISAFADLLNGDPQRPAYFCGAHTATRAELLEASRRAASYLASLGFRRGDVLAVWLPDGGVWLQFLFAAAQLGVLVVPISTRYRVNEARHAIETSRAMGVVAATEFLEVGYFALAREIQAAVPALRHLIEVREPRGFFVVDAGLPAAPCTGMAGDPLCTFSTSGTTGNPKLAVHDQAGIAEHGPSVAEALEIGPGDVLLCAVSLHGVYGFVQAIAALAGGAACVFLQVYTAQAAADAIVKFGATHMFAADGIFAQMMELPDSPLARLRFGGLADFSGMAAQVVQRAEREFGLRLFGLYGSSECFALAAAQRPQDPPGQRAMAGGLPMSPRIEVRAVNVDTGAVLPDGERGELQMRGYNVMTGYLYNPAATASALHPDGWFSTGDLGYTSGPRFVYLSRLKDGLRLRGYLVDPGEIEEFLAGHAEVLDAQVVGVNRVGEGDMAIAFARRRSAALDEAAILAYCKSGIANYKLPRRIVFVEDYPRSDGPNGTKILKNKLREMAEQLIAESPAPGTEKRS